MICQKCGKEIAESASFCPYCGSSQQISPDGQIGQAPQAAPTVQPYASQAQVGQVQTQNPYARPASSLRPHASQAQASQQLQNPFASSTQATYPGPTQNPYAAAPQTGRSQVFGANGIGNAGPTEGPAQAYGPAAMTVGQFILMFIIASIPIVGLVMLVIWGFVKKDNPTRANFAKATLIMLVIGIVFSLLFMGLFSQAIFPNY